MRVLPSRGCPGLLAPSAPGGGQGCLQAVTPRGTQGLLFSGRTELVSGCPGAEQTEADTGARQVQDVSYGEGCRFLERRTMRVVCS